ncbi:response regulator transcription factor [Sphingomonadaceae bacterium LXI357]|uniref:Response regulator transcription factor n=2 Tax=Stakelama marina TaxID=2826939 RepID=A0A8T4IE38_9SPHN|nr:response regulator transcription factor [Stakelama marina]
MLVADCGNADMVIEALDAGAGDAVPADASPEEVAARLAALIRRPRPAVIRVGDLAIDRLSRQVTRAGRPLDLLPREYAILLHLAERVGRCISRAALLRDIWGLGFDPGTNVVQVHISRLRAKLDRGFGHPLLHTEKGKGYRLAASNRA